MLIWVVSNVVLATLLTASGAWGLWGVVVLLWANGFIFAVTRVRERTFLAAFLVTFFLFLMTRDTLERVFHYAPPTATPEAHASVSAMLIAALLGVMGGYFALSLRRRGSPAPRRLAPARVDGPWGADRIGRLALVAFYVSLPGAFYNVVSNIMFVRGSSYAATYTDDFVQAQSGLLATLGQYSSEFAFVAFVIYLATLPSFRAARLPLALWVGYVGLFLFTGRRREVAVFLLFVLCYAIIRSRVTSDEPWLTRARIRVGAIAVPVLLVIFAGLEAWRGVGSTRGGFSLAAIPEFFYGQGISVKVLENVATHRSLLPDQIYLFEFAQRGIIPRILGNPVLQGNSPERALEGGSLSHSLSYVVLGPDQYLAGITTGTSFVGEAYVDLGLLGVLLVSLLYGLLIAWMDKFGSGGVWMNAARLLVAQSVLWAPRGSATQFIGVLIAPSTIAVVSGILLLNGALLRYQRRKDGRAGSAEAKRAMPEDATS
ncbi:O-antigen polysaccharide polymerase Wzy family protein [Tessaracoccus oleiagri]|uniref:Oligosaccharide repeat unit polymerase n=1 Tax=Tessaracoccus oleiagri TaxID=686624 RepID=A0A1G9KG25_9ACTN|nr:O-antigen polysaccharide polymerase Wzy family protein [Tessaracoccus oleiagri]SDL48641.1 oligosaccharide repeat unit polymerase [Tessaracoccus oleiagri]